jgi:hypothetical protein
MTGHLKYPPAREHGKDLRRAAAAARAASARTPHARFDALSATRATRRLSELRRRLRLA